MKKTILSTLTALVILASCQKEDVNDSFGESANAKLETQTVNVIVNGKIKSMEFTNTDGESLITQNKEFEEISNVLNSEDLVIYISNEIDRPMFFANNIELEKFNTNDFSKEAIVSKFGTGVNNDVKSTNLSARSSTNGSFSIYEHSYFGGRSYTASLTSSYPRKIVRNLDQGGCLTGGTNFNDKISGMKVTNASAVFKEHAGFGGKSIWIQANSGTLQIDRLKSVSFDSYVLPQDLTGCGLSCWLGSDWDDKISSITASRAGVSLSYPTSGYVCTGGSSGGGGGPISGGGGNHQ